MNVSRSLTACCRHIARTASPVTVTLPRHMIQRRNLSATSFLRAELKPDAPVDPKIAEIVEKIAGLSLLETAGLVQALKVKLNITEVAVQAVAAPAASAAAPAAEAAAPVEEKAPEKSAFKVKLEKFDAAAKAKIIREIKNLIPGSNLVEAKKFVESVPKVIKENVPKDEAEKMKTLLEGLGATIVLE
ncbi:ribosomal protein L7/L12 C-terminal domain-containing protein [Chytridium lagenaria]|nr:ribosomal protein L7/L12 C-terminal domain-containing protein [Chytridium lagenaria]